MMMMIKLGERKRERESWWILVVVVIRYITRSYLVFGCKND